MKKQIFITLMLALPFLALAQQDQRATDIMKQVEQRYEQFDNMQIEFNQSIVNPESDLNQESEGTLYLKDDSYKLETAGQQVISNGEKMWVYFEAENELIIDYANQDEAFSPSDLFSLYKKDFKFAYAGSPVIDGENMHVIIFSPKNTGDYDFHTIRLFVDTENYAIEKAELKDNMQNQVTYDIQDVKTNVNLGSDFFSFDPTKHEGIIVTDNTE